MSAPADGSSLLPRSLGPGLKKETAKSRRGHWGAGNRPRADRDRESHAHGGEEEGGEGLHPACIRPIGPNEGGGAGGDAVPVGLYQEKDLFADLGPLSMGVTVLMIACHVPALAVNEVAEACPLRPQEDQEHEKGQDSHYVDTILPYLGRSMLSGLL